MEHPLVLHRFEMLCPNLGCKVCPSRCLDQLASCILADRPHIRQPVCFEKGPALGVKVSLSILMSFQPGTLLRGFIRNMKDASYLGNGKYMTPGEHSHPKQPVF